MSKILIAFLLGLFGFFVMMFVGETAGLIAGFVALAAYYCFCQFFLSRKNADAYCKDWPVMLVLDATVLAAVFIMVLVEKWDVILSQGPGILISTCGGTYLGAVVASLTARRTAARP
jgi:hypothetical protein